MHTKKQLRNPISTYLKFLQFEETVEHKSLNKKGAFPMSRKCAPRFRKEVFEGKADTPLCEYS